MDVQVAGNKPYKSQKRFMAGHDDPEKTDIALIIRNTCYDVFSGYVQAEAASLARARNR